MGHETGISRSDSGPEQRGRFWQRAWFGLVNLSEASRYAIFSGIGFALALVFELAVEKYLPFDIPTYLLWYGAVLLLVVMLVIAIVRVFVSTENMIRRASELESRAAEVKGEVMRELGRLGDSIALVEWTSNSSDHVNRMLQKMSDILEEPDTNGIDVFSIFNQLITSEEGKYKEYYRKIEAKLDLRDRDFSYRRAVVFRLEALGYFLARRGPFWRHLSRVSSLSQGRGPNNVGCWFFGASQRLFDVAFALFYRGSGRNREVKALVIEFGRWTQEGTSQALGLLEIRGRTGTMRAFQGIFEDLVGRKSPSRVPELEPHRRRFLEQKDRDYGELLKAEMVARVGYCDALTTDPKLPPVQCDFAGGGFVASRGKCRHLHIVPHGGTALAYRRGASGEACSLRERFIRQSLWNGTLAKSVLDSYDPSVTALANHFLKEMKGGREPWVDAGVAFFEVPRIIIDANRLPNGRWSPPSDMGHHSILRKDLAQIVEERETESSEDLKFLESLAADWIEEVEKQVDSVDLVVHHHAYNKVGKQFVDHDLAPFELRPPMQVFFRVGNSGKPVMRSSLLSAVREEFLVPRLSGLLDTEYLKVEEDELVGWDYPLELPGIPFVGRGSAQHLIYEIRSDLLVGKKNFSFWSKLIGDMVVFTRAALDRKL